MTGMWEPLDSDDALEFVNPDVEPTVCRGLGLAAVLALGEIYEHVMAMPPSVLTDTIIECFNALEEPMEALGDALTAWEAGTCL